MKTAAAVLLAATLRGPAALAAGLEAPLGGRPAALGHAYTALAFDGYAPLWNAAAIPYLRGPHAAALHSSVWGASPRQLMTAAFPLNANNGLGMLADFSDGQASYGAAYGRRLTSRWSVGALGRYLEGRSDAGQMRGYAADLATLYRFDEKLTLGAVAANLGGRPRDLRPPGVLVPQARVAAAYSPRPWFTYALEGVSGRAAEAAVRTGIEVVALKTFALRAGVDTSVEGSSALGLTLGGGLLWAGHRLDLSVVPRGNETVEQVSLLLRFAGPDDPPPLSGSQSATPDHNKALESRPISARRATFHLPASSPTASGFISEPPATDWARPNAPQIPPKPSTEEAVQPGLIWLQ
jgi:hypothetical protein